MVLTTLALTLTLTLYIFTMEWWDNLWLNEGFASWMQNFAADHIFPVTCTPPRHANPYAKICVCLLYMCNKIFDTLVTKDRNHNMWQQKADKYWEIEHTDEIVMSLHTGSSARMSSCLFAGMENVGAVHH